MSKAQGFVILVGIIAVIAIGYYLFKKGFPLPPEIQNFFKFLEDAKEAINNFFLGLGESFDTVVKDLISFGNQAKSATENLLPFETTNLGGASESGVRPVTDSTKKKTTQTTTTETKGVINPDTGSFRLGEPQNVTIVLKETVEIKESDVSAIVQARESNQSIQEQQNNLRQFQIISQQENEPTLAEALQSGRLESPLEPTTNFFDDFYKRIQVFFSNPANPIGTPIPIFPTPTPLPVIP